MGAIRFPNGTLLVPIEAEPLGDTDAGGYRLLLRFGIPSGRLALSK
ncbi:MAG TPA: hypothetical protein VG013_12285 [Gemmataceae bacterium]|jgi:hypothetical protein|nr:hypothetical protein [Gemmataceae bacterium]